MLVHVKRPDGTVFQTVAVAVIYGKHWDDEVFILNEEDEFERVYAYKQGTNQIIPQVLIFDKYKYDYGWLKEDDREGYKEFIHNTKLLERIRNGEKNLFDWEMMVYWQSLPGATGHDLNYGPHPVDEEQSLNNLMAFAGGFHDASIEKVEYSEDKKDVTFHMVGVWGVEVVKLIFKGVIDMNLTEEYEWDYFFDSSIFFPNENEVVFSNCEDATSVEDLEGLIYVRAHKMFYTFDYSKPKKSPRGGPEKLG